MSAVGQKVYGYASRLRHPNLVPFAKHELLENATSYRHQHRQSSQLSVTEVSWSAIIIKIGQGLILEQIDGRSRLSRLWTPTGGISATSNEGSLLTAGDSTRYILILLLRWSRKAHSSGLHTSSKI